MSVFSRNVFDVKSPQKIALKSIEARYRREVLRIDAPAWVTRRSASPRNVFELFRDLRYETKESFIVLHLDLKYRIVCFDRVSVGILDNALIHPREVFKSACLSNAASIMLVHNHPDGNTKPSEQDILMTRRLVQAGDILGIEVRDHIIIGNGYTSFVEQCLIEWEACSDDQFR